MNASGKIQAVTFDAGGTLIRPWPSVGHVYAAAAAKHGLGQVSPEALNRNFVTQWRQLTHFNHAREEWAALVDRTFAGLLEATPSATFFPDLYDQFAGPGVWRIFEDALPAIDLLAARGINLGIISNWDDRLGPLLERLGLRKYFEVVVISCEVGFSKPSPVIFEHAARKLGLAPERILHVGDSPEDDFDGAQAAGYDAALIEREGKTPAPGHIHSLLDIEDLLA